jgi:tetratricopeptide (TPR) repeat protein
MSGGRLGSMTTAVRGAAPVFNQDPCNVSQAPEPSARELVPACRPAMPRWSPAAGRALRPREWLVASHHLVHRIPPAHQRGARRRHSSPPGDARDRAARCRSLLPGPQTSTTATSGGIIARVQGNLAMGQTFLERCVAMYRTLDDDLGLAYGLSNLGSNQLFGREFDPADANLTESLALARSAGDPNLLCIVLAPLGTLANLQGQHDRAIELLRESVTVGRTVQRADHRRFSVGRALMQLGRALFEQGKFDEAMVVFEDALAGPQAPVAGVTLSQLLDGTAAVFGATGQPLRAARLFGAADPQWLASGAKRYPLDDLMYERDLRAVQFQLEDEEFADALAEGRAMTADQAIAHALRQTLSSFLARCQMWHFARDRSERGPEHHSSGDIVKI